MIQLRGPSRDVHSDGGSTTVAEPVRRTSLVDNDDATEAFVGLCREVHPRLVNTLVLYCGNRGLAEECAQEALTRAWRDWSKISASGAAESWIFRTAFNLVKSWFRRVRVARRRSLEMGGDWSVEPDIARAVTVRRAVDALPARQRQAVILRYFADLSVEATSLAMSIAPGTVRALTAQAVASLRLNLEGSNRD